MAAPLVVLKRLSLNATGLSSAISSTGRRALGSSSQYGAARLQQLQLLSPLGVRRPNGVCTTPHHQPARGVASSPAPAASEARRLAVLDLVREQVHTHRDAFYVVDLAEVARKHAEWSAALPRVRPFYAVKCNDDPQIVRTLAALGTGFDCASKTEISMVLSTGVKPEDVIFAHPAKQPSHLHYAADKGVNRMTFDNEDEMRKIMREHPGAELVLRILTDDSASVCRLGLKFGCPLGEVRPLLSAAAAAGANVVGISYHVGSGNGDAGSFGSAVRDARTAFDIAASCGLALRLLDIGGGFPGSELGSEGGADVRISAVDAAVADSSVNPYDNHPSFAEISSVVRSALDECFPPACGVTLIAEPGRFFVKSSHMLAVNVVGKRRTTDEATGGPRLNYYVNDGLYGSFNCVLYDHVTCAPSLVLEDTSSSSSTVEASDDAIARMAPDGTPVVTDAVGLPHAAGLNDALRPLREAVAAAAAASRSSLASSRRRVMTMNGREEEEVESDTETDFRLSASGGGSSGSSSGGAWSAMSSRVAPTIPATTSLAAAARGAAVPARHYSYAPLSASSGRAPLVSTAAAATQSASSSAMAGSSFPTTLWGPTCDSIDKISDTLRLPELHVGQWLVFENMGAYTIAGSCRFNGFPLATKVYLHPNNTVEVMPEEA